MASFKHHDLRLVTPSFESPLTNTIIDLDHLRRKQLTGQVPPELFFEIKNVFHLLESLGSARIEGNNTTLSDYVESTITPSTIANENLLEIANGEQAMLFIDEQMHVDSPVTEALVMELHKLTVQGLKREGDKTPGVYRKGEVKIAGSGHKPPEAVQVRDYMMTLISFINREDDSKYDLLKVALAHHRFAWIHPFNNGNGRVVRLLTYAMLIKFGFRVDTGHILNPTAVFCANRERYYEMLATADRGDDASLLSWCEYVLNGLSVEIDKVDRLLDRGFLHKRILLPAIAYCLIHKQITPEDASILGVAVDKGFFQSGDIKHKVTAKSATHRSRIIKRMINSNLIRPISPGARKYTIRIMGGYLLRGVVHALQTEGFVPVPEPDL